MSVNQVYQNFIWRIENTIPDYSVTRNKFRQIERPIDYSADRSKGMTRTFSVSWGGSDIDLDMTDITQRTADHQFTIEIYYSADYPMDVLHRLVLDDRDKLIKILRDTDYYVGYNDSNGDTDIGLLYRIRTSDELVEASDVTFMLRMSWTCTILETE